jgi:hypothetical protein
MEEQENKTKGDEDKTKNKQKQSNPLEGLDLDGFNIPDWLKHLLTGAGTLGANYLLFIKPMQDKMETMNLEITKQDSRIKELEKEQAHLITKLKEQTNENQKHKKDEDEYFNTKRNNVGSGKSFRSGHSVRM